MSILQDNMDPFDFDCVADDPNCADNLQLVSGLNFSIQRDFGPSWSGNAQLGVAALTTLETDQEGAEGTTPTPSGSIGLNYFRPIGDFSVDFGVAANHSIAPNLLLGTITRNGGAVFRASSPLPWFRRGNDLIVSVNSTIGRQYSWVVSTGDVDEPAWHVDTFDVNVGWAAAEAWSLSGRYQFANQAIDDTGAMDAQNPAPVEFSRHTFVIEVRGQWPSRQAAELPDRRNLRVDRANEDATGDEEQQVGGGQGRN